MEFADKAWPGDEWSIAPTDKADVSFLKEKERERGRERKRKREKELGSVTEIDSERDGEKDKEIDTKRES